MNLKPLGDRLIVKPVEEEETTASGIVLPDTAKEKPTKGKVVAVGDGKLDDDEKAAVKAGIPAEQAKEIAHDYGDAQLQGLKKAIGAVAILSLLGLWFTRKLPGDPLQPADQQSA